MGIIAAESGGVTVQMISGRKSLSGDLDIVRIYTSGTFDGGKANISYF